LLLKPSKKVTNKQKTIGGLQEKRSIQHNVDLEIGGKEIKRPINNLKINTSPSNNF